MKHKLLFVCLGNICRSPAAEEIMRELVEKAGMNKEFEIDSAGTYGGHAGELPDKRMRVAARNRGYDLAHIAREFQASDFEAFDLILTMDDANYDDVRNWATEKAHLEKVRRLTDFCTRHKIDHVPDPYYEGQGGFEFVLNILEDACKNLLAGVLRKSK